ncbi:MAG: hypothetical protein CUN56_04455 [Phototrophicales bacterium]|nr:MAG: hypothetical protein CUN56_04455 [Phototrophicales bacterium]RMG76931.1 MAG: hypothetical protein D6711_02925 [Chloroflexota bacterium]
MIERLDRGLIFLYEKPLYLYAMTIVPVVFGFILSAFTPQIGQERVFYLPLLGIHRFGLVAGVIGLTTSLVFFAQHHSIRHSLMLFAITGVVVFGVMSLPRSNSFDTIHHHSTIRYDGAVYQLGWALSRSDLLAEYVLYRCDVTGVFCRVFAENIKPSINDITNRQNSVELMIQDGALTIIENGDSNELLYRYIAS